MSDRLPPHAPEAEMAVIGCCLTTPVQSIPLAQETIVNDRYFYDIRNRVLWNVLCALAVDKADIVSVFQRLKDTGSNIDVAYLSACQDAAWSSTNLPVWLEILEEKYTLRALIKTTDEITAACYSSTPAKEVLDAAERNILAIRPKEAGHQDMRTLVVEAIHKIEHKCISKGAITGLTTGLTDLDRLTDGLHAGEMIVLAGFPSTGKTALAGNIAVVNALQNIPCAIFSAEMEPVQLVVRSICSESRVNFHRVTTGDVQQMVIHVNKLSHSPLHVRRAHGKSIGQVIAEARRLKQEHGIQLVVIDYIQLLAGKGDSREQEISSISKGVKAMAGELAIPIIALSQLNDDGKLRESRAIGQDADSVWKLENDGDRMTEVQPIKLHVDKCRDGQTGTVKLTFQKTFTRFESSN
jgi:replicative DNA helicase